MKEVFNAPMRRVGHEISRLTEVANTLLMHCKIIDTTVAAHLKHIWLGRFAVANTIAACYGTTISVAAWYGMIPSVATSLSLEGIFGAGRRLLTSGTAVSPAVSPSSSSDRSNSQLGLRAVIATVLTGLTLTAGAIWWHSFSVQANERWLLSNEKLEETYQQIYARQIAEKDEFANTIWKKVTIETVF